MKDLEQIVRRIESGEIAVPMCFLCETRGPKYTSVYVPTAPVAKRLGKSEGKQRLIIYGVCEPCMDRHGKSEIMELMEQKVLARHGIQ